MSMAMNNWMTTLVYGFFKGVSLLPLPVLYFFSDMIIYPLVYYVAGYRLKVVRNNLRNSFPDLSDKELKRMERCFYRHFCDSFQEMIRVLSMTEKEATNRMHFVNPEVVTEFAAKKQGVLVVLGHYGNWEYQPFIFLHMMKAGNQQGYSVYRPLTSKAFDYIYYKIRTRFRGNVVTKEDTYRTIIQLRREGLPGVFGLVSDQSPSIANCHYWTTFLNQETSILTGPERMARQTGFAIVYADVEKLGRGHYQTTFILLSGNPKETAPDELTERYARLMERTILRDPAYWPWTHKRWKHARSKATAADDQSDCQKNDLESTTPV
jgi:KDO2-lipid IV(A) lauroyltransferase